MSDRGENAHVTTGNTMRERAGASQYKIWLLLVANRFLITAALALIVFVVFIVGVTVLPKPVQPQLQSGDAIETLFSAMIQVIITGTTLMVAISQLVISQENGPLGEQRARMETSMEFRDFTEELIGSPSPSEPSSFLRQFVVLIQQRADTLHEEMAENDNDDLRGEIEAFTDSLTDNAEVVSEQLEGASFGSFNVVLAALNFNYDWKIFQVERLANEYEDDLSDDERELLSNVKDALSLFGPAREHIKTLYFEWEIVRLSQMMLYATIPAMIVAGIMIIVVDAGMFPGTVLGIANLTWVVSGAFTVTLIPFLVFMAYILRIMTVAQRTLAIEPLILRNTQR